METKAKHNAELLKEFIFLMATGHILKRPGPKPREIITRSK